MTRLTAPLGLPLEGYTDANDRFEEQEAQLNAYLSTLWPKVEALRKENEVSGERVMLTWVVNFDVLSSYFMALLQVDIRFAAAALCFVIAYTAFHTRSVFVSCLSLIGVVLCFAVGCFWTIRVAQVTYFDPLNIFLLFVLIGIGADGIYIVSDAWTQSAEAVPYWNALHGDEEGLAYRMSYVWRRSSKAMFATNLTTMLAFISNVPSPVMPMSAFGVLSSFAVIHNLVLDVVAVPAIILIWDTYLKEKRACCCLSRTPEQAAGGGGPLRMVARFLAGPIVGHPPAESEPSSANPTPAQPTGSAGGVHTRGIVESFFADRYAPFILRFRFVVAAVMLALVGTMAFYTTRLEASKESPQFLPDSNPVRSLHTRPSQRVRPAAALRRACRRAIPLTPRVSFARAPRDFTTSAGLAWLAQPARRLAQVGHGRAHRALPRLGSCEQRLRGSQQVRLCNSGMRRGLVRLGRMGSHVRPVAAGCAAVPG